MQIEQTVLRLQVGGVWSVSSLHSKDMQILCIEKQCVVNGTTSLFTASPPFLMCEPPFHLKAQCVSDNESEQVIFKMN